MPLRRSRSPKPSAQDAIALSGAGLAAYQKALSEHLSLAHIAEQSGRPQFWFANNILHVVEAEAKRPGESGLVRLTHEIVRDLKLADDMSELALPGEDQPRFVDLAITTGEFERYMVWARTVY